VRDRQIETAAALSQLEAIAAVPGIDSSSLANDLATSMGHPGTSATTVQPLAFAAKECRRWAALRDRRRNAVGRRVSRLRLLVGRHCLDMAMMVGRRNSSPRCAAAAG
jgi:hypothetical protein